MLKRGVTMCYPQIYSIRARMVAAEREEEESTTAGTESKPDARFKAAGVLVEACGGVKPALDYLTALIALGVV